MSSGSELPDGWWFEDQPCGRTRQPGLLQKKTVDRSIDTFVREILQNITDAGLDNGDPVEVTFRLLELDAEDRAAFDDAVCWEDLFAHAESAGREQDGAGIEDYIEYLEDGGPLRVLIAEEENTTGIQGNEVDKRTDYAALVRDPGRSNKESSSAGRHGLGSVVLWVASGLQSVVFNSSLADDGPEQESPRLVGRSFLPTHELSEGECYDTEGWFGSPTGLDNDQLERPESIWGDLASDMADDMLLSRSHLDSSGTSTMILGFRDPSDPSMDDQPGPEEILDTFETATIENFWPAISKDELRVKFDMAGEERQVTSDNIDDYDSIRPFVECYEQRLDASDSLGDPGEVASVDVDYNIQSLKEEVTPTDGQVTVAARKAYPHEEDFRSEIAYFRGAGMVVNYKPGRYLGFSGKYHAILVAGEARTPNGEDHSPADEAVENFLAMAEPVAHNKWYGSGNDELQAEYESGCAQTADSLTTGVLRDGLAELFYSDDIDTSKPASPDRDILPPTRSTKSKRPEPPGPSRAPLFEWGVTDCIEDRRWRFDGQIEPNRDLVTDWQVVIELRAMFEDDQEAEQIPIDDIEYEEKSNLDHTYSDGRVKLTATDDVGRVEFVVKSEQLAAVDPRLGDATETKFKIVDGYVSVPDDEEGSE
ncbi:hypothetical protein [Haloarcula pellucida]|uniref:Uncharacterized protein n=1 Tax=Haloarcula pellucida TaxID=1427151 RepID=A0A830GNA9_9EURY|nr:hypothetical protein [Halomicroarcula pellucida]MBX0349020.1 hypothetical protein [Halomicroarcula pellucida]GGN98638.1 hypothetical protein GCM10009030_29250 [Halomicroarcula pellucida]